MSLFIILIISLIFTVLIAIYGSYYSTYSSKDAIKKEIQISHDGTIPRLGGVSILLVLISSFFKLL